METAKTIFRTVRKRATEKGSALLVSLMVLVGLSLLGLGFVALSETENSISVNQRNHAQTVAMAEAGARTVVQWFQDPEQARLLGVMPVNTNAIKTIREVSGYTGYYKPDVATPELLCDLPFKATENPPEKNRFYGTEDSADIIITEANAQSFLNTFNEKVFPPTALFGSDLRRRTEDNHLRISDIRIYAPPLVGGTLTPNAGNTASFWVDGTRYGVATIRVVAEQIHPISHRVMARAIVRAVVAEFPVPHPAGPLQSASELGTNGNFKVNWGTVTADTTLDLQKDFTSLPWFNAYDHAHYEHGYDSSSVWTKTKVYPTGTIVRPTTASITAKPALANFEFVATPGGTSDGAEPPTVGGTAWATAVGGTTPDNDITWVARRPTVWPNDGSQENGNDWLYEIVGRSVQDPWFDVRARKALLNVDKGANPSPHPYDYDEVTDVFWNAKSPLPTHWFQHQSFSQRPEYNEVRFPAMDYDFWKSVAISGNGQGGVRYLQFVGGEYTDGANTKTAEEWLESGDPGYYFFDTTNGLNPQNGGAGTLGPDINVNAVAEPLQGFFYLNNNFKSTGMQGPDKYYAQPGEPFRDIGYRKVALTTGGGQTQGEWWVDPSGNYVLEDAFDGWFSYQDLPWSNNSDPDSVDVFDVYMKLRTYIRQSDGSTQSAWLPVPYYPGCTPGTNAVLGAIATGCSEPHEPYLNLLYTGSTLGLTVGWVDPTVVGYPKQNVRDTTLITCTTSSTDEQCTGNWWDEKGGLVTLPAGLDGVFYVEGLFDSTGNADFYGSVMAQAVDPAGTPQIWFDEELLTKWPPEGMELPRVMITTIQTDQ